jgi:NADH:ubiquinone oxidoreductase subunit 6 (subunit J)
MYDTLYPNSWGLSPLEAIGLSIAVAIVFLVVIALKGMALWHSARRDEKWWFIILLVVNTIGILEFIYLFFVVGKWHKFKDYKKTPNPTNQS